MSVRDTNEISSPVSQIIRGERAKSLYTKFPEGIVPVHEVIKKVETREKYNSANSSESDWNNSTSRSSSQSSNYIGDTRGRRIRKTNQRTSKTRHSQNNHLKRLRKAEETQEGKNIIAMMLERKKASTVTVIAVYICLSIREVIVGAFRALIFGKEDTTIEEERNGPSQVIQTKNKDDSESRRQLLTV